MAIAQSLGVGGASLPSGDFGAGWEEAEPLRLHELSDADLIEMWLNVIDPDKPTAVEAAVLDELIRREITA